VAGREQRQASDRPHLLAQRSELGYTASLGEAMPGEPEAISPEEQERQTRAAQRGEQERLRREWRQTSATINDALDRLASAVRLDPSAWSSVRAVRRSTDALGRRLGL
jgi:hypothetical protein